MKKLYYATFEKGLDLIVEKYIRKRDRSARIRKLYVDSVLFFADEHFSFVNNMFINSYLVLDNTVKVGAGSMNMEMKHLLEKKNFKITLPNNVKKIKLTYIYANEKIKLDSKLKVAFETMISKLSKRPLGYYDTDVEFALISKDDGECMFVKNITVKSELSKMAIDQNGISPWLAYAMNFLSSPAEKEVSLDPFATSGMISYVRSLCFKKANVIANDEMPKNIVEIKRKAKLLKDKTFSVLNYDFLSNKFPIRYIDKIVTVLPDSKTKQALFFEKVKTLGVKVIVCLLPKYNSLYSMINGNYNVVEEYDILMGKLVKLELIK